MKLFAEGKTVRQAAKQLKAEGYQAASRTTVGADLQALAREAPGLRSEVASAISRKRAPELCFVPAYQDGGCDE